MSGGRFDHTQWHIRDIAESIQNEIDNPGNAESDDRGYKSETIQSFRDGIKALKTAYAYAYCIDYLLSGDTGEESFQMHLQRELKQVDKECEDVG